MSEYDSHQRKILHIVINNNVLYESFLKNLRPEYFSAKYSPLAIAIRSMHVKDVLLTKNSYSDFIGKACESSEYEKWTGNENASKNMTVIAEASLFTEIANIESASKDDFDHYSLKLKEHYVKQQTNVLLATYQKDSKSDIYKASSVLAESLKALSSLDDVGEIKVVDVAEYASDEWLKELEHRRTAEDSRLLTGFPEIDYAISVGLQPGMLTLFVADVGGMKTTMMLNIALNVARISNENVLFVPLEMPIKMLTHKIVSRESRVEMRKIEQANLLSDSEFEKVKREIEKWDDFKDKFVMLDSTKRLRVSDIRNSIIENYAWFKPKLLVIDYISIMRAEIADERKPTHEQIGQMCKDLRSLGDEFGISVISAAQLSRDAIKKQRTQKDENQSFGSEDLRGSHDFSADSDNIFAQMKMPSQPDEKLQVFCIKARYGSTTFEDGKNYAILNTAPNIARITSEQDATWGFDTVDDSIKHAESMIDGMDLSNDLDFGDKDENESLSTTQLSTDEIFSSTEKGKDENLQVLSNDDFDFD